MHGLTAGPYEGDNCLTPYPGGTQGLAYRASTILGMLLTDAIARYGAEGKPYVFQNPNTVAQFLGKFYNLRESIPDGYRMWIEYAEDNPLEWRETSVTVKRHGYAWSFRGTLAKFAALALVTQSLLALGHITVTTYGRWTSNAWDSIGAMIALALRTQRPAVPADHGTGSEAKETWADTVSVRLVDGDVELHFAPLRAADLKSIRS
ncbi:hypothetical protein LTR37_008124 [Vermiconidia calcicola]|uniref:Uncharacterized protein n=1 Tax=Vermiconidia calcicola TaxID=1690605 RepID=A0ACC3NBU0_9PEZI|nr:hypothetical protein LTR37_008124 [Vermiconidia calcicola]